MICPKSCYYLIQESGLKQGFLISVLQTSATGIFCFPFNFLFRTTLETSSYNLCPLHMFYRFPGTVWAVFVNWAVTQTIVGIPLDESLLHWWNIFAATFHYSFSLISKPVKCFPLLCYTVQQPIPRANHKLLLFLTI